MLRSNLCYCPFMTSDLLSSLFNKATLVDNYEIYLEKTPLYFLLSKRSRKWWLEYLKMKGELEFKNKLWYVEGF
jgi:hypothetical protein